jgi:COP9 signalosome complex subunit 3
VSSYHFSAAFPILSYPITAIDTTLSDISYNDNLVYHYTGGIALAALKQWNQAEEFFEICVSSPGQIPAAIQMEALKKLVLVQLISRGKVSTSPLSTSGL